MHLFLRQTFPTVNRCQDYIEVSSDNGHVREFCGSDVSNGLILLGTGMCCVWSAIGLLCIVWV